jgi:hypothetical protein
MSDLSIIDGVGFGAGGLVLATFCMHSMTALRCWRSPAIWLSLHTAISAISRPCCYFIRCCCR